MKTIAALSVSLVLCYCVEAQDTQPGNQPSPPPAPASAPSSGTSSSSSSGPETSEAGRRYSIGLTLSVLGKGMIPNATSTINTSTALSTEYDTQGASERIGYGLTGQVRITEHFAVDLSALLRRIGYQLTTTVNTTTTTILNGTSISTPSSTNTHEDTRSRLIDFPFVVRYYGTGRRTAGAKWFVEAGGAWRLASNIRTSIDSTDASGVNTCCTDTATEPAHRSARGLVGGAGLQLVDELGVHVVPEFRYTRWVNPIFENLTTNTQQNQMEASISLTF